MNYPFLDLTFFGLALSFVGALVIAFSVIKNPGDAHQLYKGKKLYLASVCTNKFKIGIWFFVIGSILQIIGHIQNSYK